MNPKKKTAIISAGIFILIILVFITPVGSFAQTSPNGGSKGTRLLLRLKNRPSATGLLSVKGSIPEGNITGGIPNTDTLIINVSGDEQKAIKNLQNNPQVQSVSRVPNMHTLRTTNDPHFPVQWALSNTKVIPAWDKIPALAAATGRIKVAVVDTGIESFHEDFSGKIDAGDWISCTSTDCQAFSGSQTGHEHATHVAGIIGAVTDNGKGVAGVGWGVKLISIRVLDSGIQGKLDVVLRGISWAAEHGAKIINLSIGALEEDLLPQDIADIQKVVDAAWNRGAVVIASAGNCGRANNNGNPECAVYPGGYVSNSKLYPAASNHVISVAALNVQNSLAAYSEHNDPSRAGIGNWVDLAAPGGSSNSGCDPEIDGGQCIMSTWTNNQYWLDQGTSMAAPQVAGIAALVWAANPALNNSGVKDILEKTANKGIAPGSTNNGAVDAEAAVISALSTISQSPTVTASISLTPTPLPSLTPTPTLPGATPTITGQPPPLTPTASPTSALPPYITDIPKLLKTPPDPYPTGPYCPKIGG